MDERAKAAWTLALLSPALAELVTASSLPLAFFNPILLLLLLGLYGGGVLLAREFLVRFHKGSASLIAVSLAYSIFEEALVLRSWFDPQYPNLQGLGWYGRLGGVNVVWAVWVTPFLALIAIAIPIHFTSILYPASRGQPLLSKRQLALPAASLGGVFGLIWLLPHDYTPGAIEYGLAAALAITFAMVAFVLPADLLSLRTRPRSRDSRLFLLFGGVWAGIDFFLYGLGPALGWPPGLAVLLIAACVVAGFALLKQTLDADDWQRQLFLFFAGVMALFALTDIVRGLTRGPIGLASVGVGFLLAAFILYRETWGTPWGSPDPGVQVAPLPSESPPR